MATLAELQDALKNADAAGATDDARALADAIVALKSPTAAPVETKMPTDPFPQRVAGGIAQAGLGAVQLGAHLIPGYDTSSIDENAKLFERGRKMGAPEGIDWANMIGQGVALAPVSLVGLPAAGAGTLAKTAYNVGQGAVAGLLQPTEGDYLSGKVQSAAIGGVAGGLGGAALQGIGNAVTRLQQKATAPSVNEITITIRNELAQSGIDFDKLSNTAKQSVINDTKKALATRSPRAPDELARLAAFEEVGATPTRGTLTQDPTQFARELFLKERAGGAPLAQAYKTNIGQLNRTLGELQAATGQQLDAPTAGQVVMAPLEQAAGRGQKLVSNLYKGATEKIGQTTPLNGSRIANDVYGEIQQNIGAPLPSQIASALNDFSSGKMPLDVNAAQRLIKAVNTAYKGADDATRVSLNIVRDKLDTEMSTLAQGSDAAQAYKIARQAASDKFKILDKIPALKAVSDGDAVPDDFIRKYVTGGTAKVADLYEMKKFLMQANPDAWQQVRAQVLGEIRDQSTKGADDQFLQSQFRKGLASLRKSGKLSIIFTPEEQQKLNLVGMVGKAMEGPQGVSRTGMGGSGQLADEAANMLGRVASAKVPLPGVASAVQAVPNYFGARSAMNLAQPNAAIPRGLIGDYLYGGSPILAGLLANESLQ